MVIKKLAVVLCIYYIIGYIVHKYTLLFLMPNYYLIVLSIVTDRVSEIGFSSIENCTKNGLKMPVQRYVSSFVAKTFGTVGDF